MKKKRIIIGIDVSKATLDAFIYNIKHGFIVVNGSKGFAEMLEIICTKANCKTTDLFFCFENTGKYSRMLSVFLHTHNIAFAMVSALEIKKSLGITRGKNDKVDAQRIALYAVEKVERLKPTILPGEIIDSIRDLLSLREKLIRHRTAYKNGITDLNDCYRVGETFIIKDCQERMIRSLDAEILMIEGQIDLLIKSDPSMIKNFTLLLSVKGIGKILGFYLIAFTANFTLFATARAFACYCGIAPFGYSSGTIIGKTRVHPFANKQLKSLLNMAALSVITRRGEHRDYYNKRVNELGKNKMSTLNIIRNKVLFRAFAVVNRQTPYVDINRYAA
jgi:transposase